MREQPSRGKGFLRTRDPRGVAALATLGLASAGMAFGATSATPFQVAYMYATSGPAGGGTPINVVGNQFEPGATVTIGGVGVGAFVTISTRIGATMPALTPGALYDVVVTNPGGPSSALPKGWFADFADVPAASPFHAPVETIIRDGITSGYVDGNYCPTTRSRARRWRSSCCAPSTARPTCRRRRRARSSSTSPRATSPRTGSSSSTPKASRAAARAARPPTTARRPR